MKETFGGMFRRASCDGAWRQPLQPINGQSRLDKVTSAAPGGGDLMFGVCRRQRRESESPI
ncbi:hypothetical protein [Mesorhizobium sp. M7A.F.Ce.TU.012.03.2.1]|uniref:hypothetical protein n=1 Tax=Mesorhizobium sp. M7A.F.Ce.TU.012.03.2.1 TaxID=2493681 RepID=UPI000FD99B05|nr:hypothetical protein [Mesorhizobium sp. M7A.F.Ce.TU.012.03.2.1]AZV18865.1 hypothetical protein EJ079_06970 [Mesorhizobium sp. M7A.F.Ce.TU.012.03.2.1]